MKNKKTLYVWIAAFLITAAVVIFQYVTGSTYSFREPVALNGKNYTVKLPRSIETGDKSSITVAIKDEHIIGKVSYRVYPSKSPYSAITMVQTSNGLEFVLPEQMAAGKLEYRVTLTDSEKTYESPFILVRYTDPVPFTWLIPHALILFFALLFAVAAAIMALFNYGNYSRILFVAGVLLLLGDLILGPIVQKFALGEYWTGIPFGWGLANNRILIAMMVLIYAIYRNFCQPSRLWTIVAVAVLLVIYSIPPSLYGSERGSDAGIIIQGKTRSTTNVATSIFSVKELPYPVLGLSSTIFNK